MGLFLHLLKCIFTVSSFHFMDLQYGQTSVVNQKMAAGIAVPDAVGAGLAGANASGPGIWAYAGLQRRWRLAGTCAGQWPTAYIVGF
ncbi:hypothetical protein [Hymenobacter mellowenesis]|uniref:hypothetical protein n=1 Tax=Hymenobacter mellowenesis TaxID=3063995 RepID=UPI002729F668|nr:hypothetical protein [Hymenobacter sp. M29]